MEVGSLVECLNTNTNPPTIPVYKGTQFVVRGMRRGLNLDKNPDIGLLFEEIQNGPSGDGTEWMYSIRDFVEIQKPMEISISELLYEPEYV